MSVREELSQHRHRPLLRGLEHQVVMMMEAMRMAGAMGTVEGNQMLKELGKAETVMRRAGGTG